MIYNILLVVKNYPLQTSFYQFTIDDIEMVELKKCHNNFIGDTYEDFITDYYISESDYHPIIWMLDFIKRRKLRPIKTTNPLIIDSGSWVIIHTGFMY